MQVAASRNASSDGDLLEIHGDTESEEIYESVARLLIELVSERDVENVYTSQ